MSRILLPAVYLKEESHKYSQLCPVGLIRWALGRGYWVPSIEPSLPAQWPCLSLLLPLFPHFLIWNMEILTELVGWWNPAELFQILKDDAVKVLHSICQQIWKIYHWPQDWKKSVFVPIPKKSNAKERSNYCTIALISHTSKIMLKILQAWLQ